MKNFNFKSRVLREARERVDVARILGRSSVEHPLSIHSASIEHPLQSGGNQVAGSYLARIWKYAAMLLMLLLGAYCGFLYVRRKRSDVAARR